MAGEQTAAAATGDPRPLAECKGPRFVVKASSCKALSPSLEYTKATHMATQQPEVSIPTKLFMSVPEPGTKHRFPPTTYSAKTFSTSPKAYRKQKKNPISGLASWAPRGFPGQWESQRRWEAGGLKQRGIEHEQTSKYNQKNGEQPCGQGPSRFSDVSERTIFGLRRGAPKAGDTGTILNDGTKGGTTPRGRVIRRQAHHRLGGMTGGGGGG